MSLLYAGLTGSTPISQSGSYDVVVVGAGTINIAGTAQSPISVILGSFTGLSVLNTINVSYATVTLTGTVGIQALAAYNIGAGGTLVVQSTANVHAGTAITFTAPDSHLVIAGGSLVNLNLLGTINGFGPGSSIDLSSAGFSSYSYADAAGPGTGGTLTLYDANHNATGSIALSTGDFTTSSFYVHPDSGTGTLIELATTISGVSASPANADLTVGGNVVLTLATSAPVTVTGTPRLTLNDGGVAIYDATHSTSTSLAFNYTVGANQNTADLSITGSVLNGAAITDARGNPVNLAGANVNPAGTLQIDTTAPTILGVSTSPTSGSLSVGQIVTFNLTPSEAVNVTGRPPSLLLNDGGIATYDAVNSTSTNLVFNYTVLAGQNVDDLSVIGVNLNNGLVTDNAGNAAIMTGAAVNPTGILQIDTTTPTITGVSTNPGSGSLNAGRVVAFTLTPSEALLVNTAGGAPTLTLSDGGTAYFDLPNSNNNGLVFNYLVLPGDNATDLSVTRVNLNGATVTDRAGNAANLTGADINPAGILQIDTIAPTIVSVSTTPANGTLRTGQTVSFNLQPSEAVTVNGGAPTLLLSDSGTALYDSDSSTATNLVFKYVVQPGDISPDLTVAAVVPGIGTITDAAGNLANLSGALSHPPGSLQVDGSQPPVTSVYSVTTNPGDGDLGVNRTVQVSVNLTGPATVVGTPTLTLNDGGTASYVGTTGSALLFDYVVGAGDTTADLTVTGISPGAVVLDANGHPVDLSGIAANPGGILQIDTTPPTILGVSTTPGSGAVGAGTLVSFNVATSEAVTVSSAGIPTLLLNDNGVATYSASASTPNNLVFTYTVGPNDSNVADLAVTSYLLNGATIADGAGNALSLAAVGNPSGILQVDTIAPIVIDVTAQPGTGTVIAGQPVTISVTPSEAVTVSGGTPTLWLNDGGIAIYDPIHSTSNNLIFTYTPQAGENTAGLGIIGSQLNGATITDAAQNPLNLSNVIVTFPGMLQVNTVPNVTGVTVTPLNGDLTIGGTITFQVNTSGPVVVTDGTPTLTLSDGATAVYDPSSSTPTMLVFRNTVQAGDNSPDISVAAVMLNGALVTDGAGHAVDLSPAVANPSGVLQVDTTPPTVVNMVFGGSIEPGQVFTITSYISEPVTVSGGPFMYLLANGGEAVYAPQLSTPTALVATYTVPAGSALTPADVTIATLQQNGASAVDGAGNQLDVPSAMAAIAKANGNFSNVITTPTAVSPTTIDVYRFFDSSTGTHFYTQDPNERQVVLTTRPDLIPEGPNGVGLTAVNPASNDPNAVPVYRFFDSVHGTHFFTASSTERDQVIATRPDMVYEASSTFYEHTTPQAGDTAVYRFFDSTFGTHFYTDSPTERASISQSRPDLVQEGVGFYEPARNPAASS